MRFRAPYGRDSCPALPARPLGQGMERIIAKPDSRAEPLPDPDHPKMDDPTPLRAVHTPNFPALLRQLGASLLVTTYQAGKLVLFVIRGTTSTPTSAPSRLRWAWPWP